ncbi:hypothetical protein QUA71_06950 [Microcoleus sp. MON1_C5]|uniref:hypothetical protein n=1 Tax=Microcoleus sp. MON1_C5 TaxID=2818828 RepID=UPI002FD2CA04
MSVCKGIGNGIGGAIGKWGAGLGSALGLGAAVDLGVRTYTGYGLLETLSVPYIECPDGSFASAMEWYGSGLRCPKRPDPAAIVPSVTKTQGKAAKGYAAAIAALGGSTITYFGYHGYAFQEPNTMISTWAEGREKHYDNRSSSTDKLGNAVERGFINEGTGTQGGRGSESLDTNFMTERNGKLGSYFYVNFIYPSTTRTEELLAESNWFGYQSPETPWTYIGTIATIPDRYEKAPPAISIPPKAPFSPSSPQPPEECDMSCPCLTKADVEQAVKKALGVKTFSPEKLIREIGAKMFVAPGPSLVPVIPKDLVEAIAALVAANYMRAGYARYPVLMPNSLINDDSVADAVPALPIENFAEWFEWHIKQQDAIQGEWPIDIAIVDGAKRQPLKFENISEALAELTGIAIQTATDADAAVSVASHAAVAATKATTAAVIAQKNAECIIKFFGIRTGFGSIFVDSVITPMDSDSPNFNLKKFLTPSKQSVAFYTDDDPFDFQAVLDRILRNSEISKSAVAMDASKEIVGDYARNQRKYDAAEAKREAEKELEKLETSLKTQNPGLELKIRVDTPAAGEIVGNNFVIKRPKSE